jgi:hypothetical protein
MLPVTHSPIFPLFNVALQDQEKLSEFALTFRAIRSALDTLFGMKSDHELRESFERFAGRNDLSKYLGTVAIVINHPFNGGELTRHFANTQLKAFLLFLGMYMQVRHAAIS